MSSPTSTAPARATSDQRGRRSSPRPPPSSCTGAGWTLGASQCPTSPAGPTSRRRRWPPTPRRSPASLPSSSAMWGSGGRFPGTRPHLLNATRRAARSPARIAQVASQVAGRRVPEVSAEAKRRVYTFLRDPTPWIEVGEPDETTRRLRHRVRHSPTGLDWATAARASLMRPARFCGTTSASYHRPRPVRRSSGGFVARVQDGVALDGQDVARWRTAFELGRQPEVA